MKLRKSSTSPHADLRHLGEEFLLHLRPQRAWDIGPGRRRALLALVLEGAPHQRRDQRGDVGGGMGKDEVLPTGLADDAGVGAVASDVLADGPPHGLEDRRGAGEVEPRKVGGGQHWVPHLAARATTKLMTPGGSPAAMSSFMLKYAG